MIGSDYGTEFTSNAMLAWSEETSAPFGEDHIAVPDQLTSGLQFCS